MPEVKAEPIQVEEITQENQKEELKKLRKEIIKQMENIKFYERDSDDKQSLSQEFITPNSKQYTIMLLNFRSIKEASSYASRYDLDKNSVIFGFKDKFKLIHGVYDNYEDAIKEIEDFELFVKRTKPYVRRIYGYQSLYNKYNNQSNINAVYEKLKNVKVKQSIKPVKKVSLSKKVSVFEEISVFEEETLAPIKINIDESSNEKNTNQSESVFEETKPKKEIVNKPAKKVEIKKEENDQILSTLEQSDEIETSSLENIKILSSKEENALSLEKEFLSKKSKKYTIVIMDFKNMKEALLYVNRYALDSNSLIFKYSNKYKLIHGAYDNFSQALRATKKLQAFVQKTKPYVRQISGYQELYAKYNKTDEAAPVIEKKEELEVSPVKELTLPQQEKSKSEMTLEDMLLLEENPKKKDKDSAKKKTESIIEEKNSTKDEISEVPVEPKEFKEPTIAKNIKFSGKVPKDALSLEKEFTSKKSKKYTIMILDFENMKDAMFYASAHGLHENSVIFKYSNKFKLIHGAYDSFKEATLSINELVPFVKKNKPYVRKISGYQELYAKYNSEDTEGNYFPNLQMKNDFFEKNSKKYTITLTTSRNFTEARWFREKYKINNDTIVYKFGTKVKVIYGIFNSAKEANEEIDNFDNELMKLKPFVNRITTHQKLYNKYNMGNRN